MRWHFYWSEHVWKWWWICNNYFFLFDLLRLNEQHKNNFWTRVSIWEIPYHVLMFHWIEIQLVVQNSKFLEKMFLWILFVILQNGNKFNILRNIFFVLRCDGTTLLFIHIKIHVLHQFVFTFISIFFLLEKKKIFCFF